MHTREQRERFTTHDLVYIALMAALWGLVETSLGNYLHAARVPFRGAVLTAIGIGLALCGRALVDRRGVVLMTGAVTALLRLAGVGTVLLWPLLGILMESLLAELVLLPFARPGRGAYVLAGAAATLWTVIHPFVTQGLLAGSGMVAVYGWMLQGAAQLVPFWRQVAGALVICGVGVPLALGALSGLAAFDLGRRLQTRLAR
jgi:hypothetical protein